MAVTAAQVKELRERTGLGMMECKKALVETNGDIETAIDNLRKSGQAKAAKKAGRTAAEGIVVAKVSADGKTGILLEVNSETDFVARDDNFLKFANGVADRVLATKETDMAKLLETAMEEGGSDSIETTRSALVQKIGENIQVRRTYVMESEGLVSAYVHSGKIGVLVALNGGNDDLGKDVAMHVAASNPLVVNPDQVDQATLDKEKEIFSAQAAESGKPPEIVEKMVQGRIAKFLKEVSLVDQPFVKDPDTTVGKLVKGAGADVVAFTRIEVGEGIEKEEVDFAAEVMAQARGE
ncbi:MAG: elongation factor Ts [Pseudomonadales bacterium]|jgi:elongation factor Ts|uniref:translation elongation factor Ts n=1 Tax=unclassified Ketobacter TaxID=2639109 RepID=UPI000C5046F3|nr:MULTISPECIES: translation elongation factor Ts [unclassified Ketobacter]MAQ25083.1 elongation factor Ts [Pseudomonadales bacterium]HAG93965.1 elongation factor Ts [Gammaproteobacteria bacterium]MBI26933.1 elongation factor Ts [Pseudomonadales bacterium]RLT88525.1 MAG: elongation factor Ts [Ketobacter sp. GenoA1]RLT95401.1 MAG: elongation factor Ts [Ketobacter sp.]|tara:strand:- start:3608 stop:4492 length:885 start_codon:yes stop_codon:yes gene_type:complete